MIHVYRYTIDGKQHFSTEAIPWLIQNLKKTYTYVWNPYNIVNQARVSDPKLRSKTVHKSAKELPRQAFWPSLMTGESKMWPLQC
jgi:hypothetical protein